MIYYKQKGDVFMAQTNINIRMDEELKKQFDAFCSDVGMSMTTAFCIFAKTVVRQHRIPFEISTDSDPFYSKDNINYLEKVMSDVREGRAHFSEHDLIEVDDE